VHAVVVAGSAILGVPVGAVLNLLIDRVPHRVPLTGRRAEEACAPVRWLGLPAQPWLLRSGRADGARLPPRWLWVELTTAALFTALAVRFGGSTLVPMLVLGACLVTVSVIDLQLQRIPDRITFPTLAVALPLIAVVSLHQDHREAIKAAVVGSVAYFLLLFITHFIYPAGMGFGDVKLALVMGLYLGWMGWTPLYPVLGPIRLVVYALMMGCIIGVVFGLAVQFVTKRRGAFAFGPALAAGCLVAIFLADHLRA
jgi:leader peptidase (prepilin peptidase)/N-methyltransferase